MAGEFGEDSPAAKVAAVARVTAAAARASAASDRERAARDREAAARDRELLIGEIERSHVDESTGAYGRRTGEVLLRHEVERAQGAEVTLTLGVVRVDAALARDLLLALQAALRPYDPIVRWVEDELVCAVAGISPEDAGRRIDGARSDVAERHPGASPGVGLAGLEDGDTLDSLVERARRSLAARPNGG
jgi:GGDEF domain-containing protein